MPRLYYPGNSRRFPETFGDVCKNKPIFLEVFVENRILTFAPVDFRRKPEPVPRTQVHPVSITRFPLSRFSPGAGLLRNPCFALSTLRFSRGWVRKDGNLVMETGCTLLCAAERYGPSRAHATPRARSPRGQIYTILYHTILYHTMLCYATLYYTILYYYIIAYILYTIIPYDTMLGYAILYYTILPY